jgi:hypothetical protein
MGERAVITRVTRGPLPAAGPGGGHPLPGEP